MNEQELNKNLANEELARSLLDWAGLLELRKVVLTGREGEEYERDTYFFKPTNTRLVTQCWQDETGKWNWQVGWYGGFGWLTQSLDACFKWLVPKLDQAQYYSVLKSIFMKTETPALALCRAIDKLIDSEEAVATD